MEKVIIEVITKEITTEIMLGMATITETGLTATVTIVDSLDTEKRIVI